MVPGSPEMETISLEMETDTTVPYTSAAVLENGTTVPFASAASLYTVSPPLATGTMVLGTVSLEMGNGTAALERVFWGLEGDGGYSCSSKTILQLGSSCFNSST